MEKTLVITEFHTVPLYRNDAGIYDFVTESLEVFREMKGEFEGLLNNLLDYCENQWPEICQKS